MEKSSQDPLLSIRRLTVEVEGKKILTEFNLNVSPGEVHAIMGPNGSGKSTLAKVLAGDTAYDVVKGEVLFEGKNLLALAPEERSRSGVFLAFQYPVEIPGVNTLSFLRMAYNSKRKNLGLEESDPAEFRELALETIRLVGMPEDHLTRQLNVGFSGGEKKRNEILQMALLDPKLAVLDEVDSGLDIDAMRIIAAGVNRLRRADNAFIVITHYQRLLNYIRPDNVHVLSAGRIVKSGDSSLALQLEKTGYEKF